MKGCGDEPIKQNKQTPKTRPSLGPSTGEKGLMRVTQMLGPAG